AVREVRRQLCAGGPKQVRLRRVCRWARLPEQRLGPVRNRYPGRGPIKSPPDGKWVTWRLSSELPKTAHTIGANAVKAACAAAEPRPCIGNSVENWLLVPRSPM